MFFAKQDENRKTYGATSRFLRRTYGLTLVGLLMLAGWSPSGHADGADVTVSNSGIFANATVGADKVVLRLNGPEDFTAEVSGHGGSVSWYLPAGAPAGAYHYDVFVVVDDPNTDDGADTSRLYRETGSFAVQGSQVRTPDQVPSESRRDDRTFAPWEDTLKSVGRTVVDLLIPTASAANLTASSSGNPLLEFDETDGGTAEDWVVGADGDGATLGGPCGGDTTGFGIFDDVDDNCRKVFELQDGVNSLGTFIVDDNGDISLANDSVFIDRSTDHIGIGTTTPVEEIHIVDSAGGIRIDNGGTGVWDLEESASDFRIFNVTDGVEHFTIEDGTGNVGIGNVNPTASLQVDRSDGTASILVTETNGTATARSLFDLVNNGPVGFNMEDTANAQQWRFAAQTSGFRVSLAGSGGREFEVGNDGSLTVGPAGVANMFLDTNGNATFEGTVTADGTLLTSSREAKENIEPVDAAAILERIAELPLARWSYKGKSERHIGPMAEDFHAQFGFGPDDEHVSPADMAGVAMASVQALKQQLDAKDNRIEVLEAELERQKVELERRTSGLQAENTELRARVEELAGMVGQLATRLEAGDDQLAEALR